MGVEVRTGLDLAAARCARGVSDVACASLWNVTP